MTTTDRIEELFRAIAELKAINDAKRQEAAKQRRECLEGAG